MPDQAQQRTNEQSRAEAWVERFIGGMPAGGRVLDLACGGGRHAALCLSRGLSVTAVDRDISAAKRQLPQSPQLELIETDLEDGRPFPFAAASFDGVIVVNYLWRPLLSALIDALRPRGLFLYQTFRAGNERHGKPSNPAFLLEPGELLGAVQGRLHVVAYEDIQLGQPPRLVQRIAATGPRHDWVGAPPPI